MSTRLPAALLAALAMLVLVAAPAGAQTRTGHQVGAGALLARTTDKPWGLVFLERSGRTALSELPGAGLGFLERLRLGPCHPGAPGPALGARLRGHAGHRRPALAAVSHCASRPTARA